MKPLKAEEICGVWGSLLLPLNADESIDFAALEREIRYLCGCTLNGLYSNGTACEFFTQSEKEFEAVSEMTASICGETETPFQLGASHMDYNVMRARIKAAVKYKPGAIQVILPDWFPMSDAEIRDFLKRAVELASGIGIVLYNPPHSKRVLKPEDLKKLLLPVRGIVGLKTGAGDAEWYADMKEVFSAISVFCPGHDMARAIQRGAHGSYSNVACLSPKGAAHWYGLIQNDSRAALKLEDDIHRFMTLHIAPLMARGYAGFVMDKLMAAAGNWVPIDNRVRRPYHFPDKQTIAGVRQGIAETLPAFAEFNTKGQ